MAAPKKPSGAIWRQRGEHSETFHAHPFGCESGKTSSGLGQSVRIDDITFANTGIPIIVIGTLALVVPFVLVPRQSRRQVEVAVWIFASAGVLYVSSAFVLWASDPRGFGAGLIIETSDARWGTLLRLYLQSAAPFALLWAPILAIVWFGKAQRVERLKSDDTVRGAP